MNSFGLSFPDESTINIIDADYNSSGNELVFYLYDDRKINITHFAVNTVRFLEKGTKNVQFQFNTKLERIDRLFFSCP